MTGPDAEPTISVALCTYNGERYLQEQLETIAAQTRVPFEMVICDDCSKDRTLEIAEAFRESAPFQVRVVRNASQLRSTRNFDKAIRLCRGDYIALSDQDDRWKPQKVERLAAFLDADLSAGMIFSDAALIDGDSRPTGQTLWQSLRFRDAARSVFRTDPGRVLLERPVVTGATMMFRRSLLDHFGVIPPTWVHDGWITWMSVFWSKPLFTEELLTEYRVHVGQQLGVGKTSLGARLQEIRAGQQAHYASVAGEIQDLRSYVEQASPVLRERWEKQLSVAIDFLQARADAPLDMTGRLGFLVRNRKHYRGLSGPGWRSMARDLLMGTKEKH